MPGSNSPRPRIRERLRAAERELHRQDSTVRRLLAELRSSDSPAAPLADRLLAILDRRSVSPTRLAPAALGPWRRA